MAKQLKQTLKRENLSIRNLKYSDYDIVNLTGLSKIMRKEDE